MRCELAAKYAAVEKRLTDLGSVLVAFSGGVDSAVVLVAAVRALGAQRVLAVTARSPSVPPADLADATRLAGELGVGLELVDTGELENPRYASNPPSRCYHCKAEVYGRLKQIAAARGLAAVVSGANADDLNDYRPGLQAGRELGVRAPLAEAGLTKSEVRELAAALGLWVHDKPASPCLASRVPYGQPITAEKLRQISAAEALLRELGFRECRVRHHGELARIEVPVAEVGRLVGGDLRQLVDRELRELGFAYVTLDLRGFRSGSLNEVLARGGGKSE